MRGAGEAKHENPAQKPSSSSPTPAVEDSSHQNSSHGPLSYDSAASTSALTTTKAKQTSFVDSDEEDFDNRPTLKKRRRVIVQDSSGEEFSSEEEEEEEQSEENDSFGSFLPPLASTHSLIAPPVETPDFIPGFVRSSTTVGGSGVKKAKLWESVVSAPHVINDDIETVEEMEKPSLASFFEYLTAQASKSTILKDKGPSGSQVLRRVSYNYETGVWKIERTQPVELMLKSREQSQKGSVSEKLSQTAPKANAGGVKCYIEIRHGDLTGENVDVVVNAANSYLAHGGGVAGAIVSKGGNVIQKESDEWVKRMGDVPTGRVGVTGGGKLKAKFVVHAVGPVYSQAANLQKQLEQELYDAVYHSLLMANNEFVGAQSISIPAISSGIFGFPKDRVARILFSAAIAFITNPHAEGANNGVSENTSSLASTSSSQESILVTSESNAPKAPSNPPSYLRLIRFTNFDMPTVQYFLDRFDLLFSSSESTRKLMADDR